MGWIQNKYNGAKRRFDFYYSVNWIKTIYFNFKMFPIETAQKLPVFFYGKIKFSNLSGKIIIGGPIKRAMIGFGQKFEFPSTSKGVAELSLKGTLCFKSNAHIGLDCAIAIAKNAYCEFGFMGCLGSNVTLICTEKIIIGEWCGIGYNSQIIDTNSHPMKNTETGEVYPISSSIQLGNHNAFSNSVSIMPGTKTPDNCVIASHSLCNKDYTKLGENILIGGIPAKLIKNNFARDWESEKEMLLKSKRVI